MILEFVAATVHLMNWVRLDLLAFSLLLLGCCGLFIERKLILKLVAVMVHLN